MKDTVEKHPVVFCIVVAAAVVTATYTTINVIYIEPLKIKNIELNTKIDNISKNIKSSNEYISINTKLIRLQEKHKLLVNQTSEYNNLIRNNTNLKIENEFLKKEFEKKDKSIISLKNSCTFVTTLDKLKNEQKKAEEDLDDAMINNHQDKYIQQYKSEIDRKQEQINNLLKYGFGKKNHIAE